jgi:hypothetical protein
MSNSNVIQQFSHYEEEFINYAQIEWRLKLFNSGRNIYERKITTLKTWLPDIIPDYEQLLQEGNKSHAIVNDNYFITSITDSIVTDTVVISPDESLLQDICNKILDHHTNEPPPRVRWVYDEDGTSVRLPIDTSNLPRKEFYPFLTDETLAQYYDRYVASRSNILVLMGPPGTGKTSFIKGLINHTRKGAILSYDNSILERDSIFTNFMSGNDMFMVLEDADTFLGSRNKTRNTVMHRFLNVGDGLISTSHKKIIFSTNLPSLRDIDPALIRPGRCFDVVKFDKLNKQQCLSIDSGYSGEGEITLAQLICGVEQMAEVDKGVGF